MRRPARTSRTKATIIRRTLGAAALAALSCASLSGCIIVWWG